VSLGKSVAYPRRHFTAASVLAGLRPFEKRGGARPNSGPKPRQEAAATQPAPEAAWRAAVDALASPENMTEDEVRALA
jgi:hypothetical protein